MSRQQKRKEEKQREAAQCDCEYAKLLEGKK